MDLEGLFWYRKMSLGKSKAPDLARYPSYVYYTTRMLTLETVLFQFSHFKDAFDIWRKKGCEQKNEFNIDGQEMIFHTVEKILIWKASNMPI
ncbi:hypothetical protein HanRHA438_Chr14g0642621 [Helianthus annuus]|nr:hypothetical protein HanRHA438_Chr14g0642621 [Helianthus annuus]